MRPLTQATLALAATAIVAAGVAELVGGFVNGVNLPSAAVVRQAPVSPTAHGTTGGRATTGPPTATIVKPLPTVIEGDGSGAQSSDGPQGGGTEAAGTTVGEGETTTSTQPSATTTSTTVRPTSTTEPEGGDGSGYGTTTTTTVPIGTTTTTSSTTTVPCPTTTTEPGDDGCGDGGGGDS